MTVTGRFEVLMAVIIKSAIFCDVTPCSLVTYPVLHLIEKYILAMETFLMNLQCKLKNLLTQNG
jgi:hypothetical protein